MTATITHQRTEDERTTTIEFVYCRHPKLLPRNETSVSCARCGEVFRVPGAITPSVIRS